MGIASDGGHWIFSKPSIISEEFVSFIVPLNTRRAAAAIVRAHPARRDHGAGMAGTEGLSEGSMNVTPGEKTWERRWFDSVSRGRFQTVGGGRSKEKFQGASEQHPFAVGGVDPRGRSNKFAGA